jgi:hypothetical protein
MSLQMTDVRVHGARARAISSNTLRGLAVIRALRSAVQAWASGRGPGAHVVKNPNGVVGAAGLGERVEEPVSQLGRWGSARREGKRAGGGGEVGVQLE